FHTSPKYIRMRRRFLLLLASLAGLVIYGQQKPLDISIIPAPVSITSKTGNFSLDNKTRLVVEHDQDRASAEFFQKYLADIYGIHPEITARVAGNCIVFKSDKTLRPAEKQEGY